MAKASKSSNKPNKSQVIRDYLDSNPGAKPKEIVEAHPNMNLTTAFVSTIKSNYLGKDGGKTGGKRKGARRVGRKTASGTGSAPKAGAPKTRRGQAASDSVSLDALLKMKNLVDQIGSVDEARSALAALEKIRT